MVHRVALTSLVLPWLLLALACSDGSREDPVLASADVGMRLVYEVRGDADPGEVAAVVRARLSDRAEGKAVVLPDSDARHLHVGVARGLSPEDLDRIRRLVSSPGRLEMRVLAPQAVERAERSRRDAEGDGYVRSEGVCWVPQRSFEELPPGPDRLVDESEPCFTGADLEPDALSVEVDRNGSGWVLLAAMKKERRDAFGDFTEGILGRELALIRDGRLVSAPIVRDRLEDAFHISGGVYGGFTRAEAEDFVAILRSGPLPAEVVLVEEREVGPEGRE